jgi:hypothetical protein
VDGPLTGNLTSSSGISVLGNDSYGVKAGNVSGNVTIPKGTITVQAATALASP